MSCISAGTMENKEKNSPKPSHNLFDNAAAAGNLLGVHPFGLPYAHLPSTFSLLGHYPSFPSASLFGELGERGLASLPPGGALWSYGASNFDNRFPDFFAGSLLELSGKFSSASKSHSLSSSKDSPKSSPKTVTKATTTIATPTTTSFSNSTNSRKTSTTITSVGESLMAGKSLLAGRSLLTGNSLLAEKFKKSKLSSAISPSHTETNGIASSSESPPLKSPKRKNAKEEQVIENGDHHPSEEDQSEDDLVPNRSVVNGNQEEEEETMDSECNSSKKNSTAPSIHIDGLKKKLIADQIRQRVQNKPIQSVRPSIMQPMKRGRGRPPKQTQTGQEEDELQLKKLREKHEKEQEALLLKNKNDLKAQLEANLRIQQMELKLMKKQKQQEMDLALLYQKKQQELLKQGAKDKLKYQQEKSEQKKKELEDQKKKEIETTLKVQQLLKLSEDERKARGGGEKTTKGKSPSSMKINQLLQEKKNEGALMSQAESSNQMTVDEKLEAKVRAMLEEENSNDSGSGESEDSDSENENQAGMDSMSEISDSTNEHLGSSKDTRSTCSKRSADEMSESSPTKKPRVQMDEAALQIPLDHGFKRSTTIHAIGKRGFIGEVLYFGPCGKKMKTIPDVMRYLERNNIKEFGRENFSFNTRVKVGQFFEGQAGTAEIVKLNDEQVRERMALIESKRQKLLKMKQMKGSRRQEKQNKQIQLAKQMMEQKLKKRMEQQEMAKRAAEFKIQRKSEKLKQKDTVRKIRENRGSASPEPSSSSTTDWQSQIYCLPDNILSCDPNASAVEKRKQKEQLRALREQEKHQRQEQMRMEREMRAQQILESNLLWYHLEREREMKRHQAIIAKEQERERKRHHFMLVKAIEHQKKQAKDKLKEDRMMEKRLHREKKMEQRRLELQLARELKKPVEDMELKDHRALPDFERIPGCKLDAVAFGDILMVLEFIHNFKEALGFNDDTLPTLKLLQDQVMFSTEEDGENFMALTCHLLKYAVMEPGVPNPKEATTCLGQKIADVPITESVVSEILRIFIIARNGKPNEMSDWLSSKPLESLTISQKASVLAFLVNELMCGRHIVSEIERQLEHMGEIRRDKWVVEGKLRRLKAVHNKKFKSVPKPPPPDCESASQITSKKGSDEEDEKEEESGNDSGGEEQTGTHEADGEDEEPTSYEECEKEIDKLQKQHAQYRAKVFKASYKVRAISLGQDRYKRRYWVLPTAGGVYVESQESGYFNEEIQKKLIKQEVKKEIKVEVNEEVKKDLSEEVKSEPLELTQVKSEVKERKDILKIPVYKKEVRNVMEECDEYNVIKSEKSTLNQCDSNQNSSQSDHTTTKSSENISNSVKTDSSVSHCNGEDFSIPSTSMCKSAESESSDTNTHLHNINKPGQSNSKSDSDIKPIINSAHASPLISPYPAAPSSFFSPPISGASPSLLGGLSLSSTPSSTLTSTPLPAHQQPKSSTPSSTDTKHNFLSIDSLLKKDSSSSSASPSSKSSLFPSPVFPLVPMTPDQMIKSFSENSSQKPWFSILPRLPCEDMSMTHSSSQMSVLPSPFQNSFLSPLSFHSFPIQSPSFSSFNMSQLFGNSDISGMSLNSTAQSSDSFKIPNTPRSETDTPSTSILEQNESLLKELQGEAQPIPEEVQKGWWKISEEEHVRTVHKNLHPRGIREKCLQKSLQKCLEYTCSSCNQENKEVYSLVSDASDDEEKEDKTEEKCKDKKIEKEDTNSSEESPAEEKEDKEEKMETETAIDPEEEKIRLADLSHQVELQVLEEVENLEERIASASLQVKGWKVPQRISEEADFTLVDRFNHEKLGPNEKYPLDAARDKLSCLEPNIERRYLKPPLCKVVQINLANITANTGQNDDDEEDRPLDPVHVSPGMMMWRNAVTKASSPAQLSLCVTQLNKSISWEKSIMKVLCQLCRRDDNEAELLLCDGCDQGYHTYCFKPKMENIPDGDWYCYECISKATGEPCCVVCGKRMGRIVECDLCPRAIHLDCLDPPLPRMPRKWVCPACTANQGLKGRGRKSPKKKNKEINTSVKERRDSDNSSRSANESMPTEKPEKKRGKDLEKKKQAAEQSEDMTVCRLILTEMDKHEDGWPFLKPVNFKQFPAYKKYIRQPMDFTTMKNKLRDNQYKTRGDFASDVRLIFNNCQTFNEDDSEVGRSGHNMRKFFEARWKQLMLSSSPTSNEEKMEEGPD
ncbi:bromodomain adjacent to zinc finger domain protein 2B-like isoform X7 [Ostrea edulis]|uniref:bromodomain adjacent to zinc finger domain protein 2B-like isoform X7 n=2 Tax=Ostrea edulis TaxID=37623 RepID=UPI0024AE8B4D|nr:bromodomain adjacent to zinc finger domain protein 2B-like isoform X7 [Ostrea edulis]